jgi:hypothetical protein
MVVLRRKQTSNSGVKSPAVTRVHGVFAPNSKYGAGVTPARRGKRIKSHLAGGPITLIVEGLLNNKRH